HMINSIDKKRSNYYNYYTNKQWGFSDSYHLCIDSSVLGIEGSADFIKLFIEENKK
ncbi:MAG: cytidylate kinase-like family protein, partial [Bacteroidales bacterium]|nr:cytidylate kinase-like family protein [Bacteroidales bacterium]